MIPNQQCIYLSVYPSVYQVLELQREIGEMQQKEAAARALPAVLARRAGGVSQGAPQHVHVH